MKRMCVALFGFAMILNSVAAQDNWPEKTKPHPLAEAYGKDAASAPKTNWPPKGSSQKYPFTKDDVYSLVGFESKTNSGQYEKLKLKGRQEFFVFDADLSSLEGKVITGALLHVKNESPKDPFFRVGVSSMSSDWKEGSAKEMYKKIKGEACFDQVALGEKDWSYKGSNVLDVIFGLGHTTWKFADCTSPDDNAWQKVAVDPKVIAAKVAGISYGFAAWDEVGSEWSDTGNKFSYKVYPNRFCYSRSAGKNRAPYLEIWTAGEDKDGPESVQYSKVITNGYPAGEALFKWITPEDKGSAGTIGYDVTYKVGSKQVSFPRYLIPMAGKAGTECRMHIQDLPFKSGEVLQVSIVPVDAAGNKGKSFDRKVKLSSSAKLVKLDAVEFEKFAPSEDLPSVGGIEVGVIDVLDKVDPVKGSILPEQTKGYRGGNHLFSAKDKKVRLYAAKNEFVWFQLLLKGEAEDIKIVADLGSELTAEFFESAYVGSEKEDVQDPLMPIIKGAVSIPSKQGVVKIAGQKYHTVLCEIFVPHAVKAGKKKGAVTISVNGKSLSLDLELNVWDFTLPNKLSFLSEMNSYGVDLKNNYELHRVAHKHRLVLNQLPYGWTGNPAWKLPFDGESFDWAWFDKNIGPLLDGSAFKGLPRSGVPVQALYLPFNENWPVKITDHYKSDYWADTALSKTYIETNKKAYAAFAKHADEKAYHNTFLEFYLNNKIYYRDTNLKSVCPWILDEPNRTQDFWALRYYGILYHQAIDPVKGKAKMIYRTDISYPEHGRETMWGVCDRVVIGGSNTQKMRLKKDEWQLWQKNFSANYGSANKVSEPNTQPVAWSLLSWSQGSTGVLPWQTIAKEKDWTKGSKTGLFYPHETGTKVSIRVKSFTRGQQDIEYLTWFKEAYGLDHFTVANTLMENIDLTAKIYKVNETDAGLIRFAEANPTKLWEFRVKIGNMISKKKPAYRESLVDWSLPKTDMSTLPDIGHTAIAPKVKPHGPTIDSFKVR